MQGSEPAGLRTVARLLWLSAAFTGLYWVVFFTSGATQATQEPCYTVFERAFPAADAWLAIAALACASSLRRRRPRAVLWGVAAGSAFIYLGLMDTLYNLENGMYASIGPEMAAEVLINVTCFLFGPFLMSYVWRHRRWLGA
ncbi:MAG: hypothetical protein HYR72_17695 [Deltaproteobacteria bacterium]|nr:hypothetical protein [Deltaproteobacteria bacterium]MBI3386445.1 hypothetical protein [Deltaproteobacteria bacterium]